MVFLNPAILFGLLAASIPILIHLLNLRKLKRIEFSTLSFLKELQKNKIRKIKLKQWLLLALRVFIILMLVTAFARPTLEGVALGGTTSAAKTSAVFILDNTFSMSVVDAQGSYFNQSKGTLNSLLNQFQEGDDASLILLAEDERDLKLSSNLIELRNKIDEAEISYSSGTLHSAVTKAARLLSESNNFNKEIYLLTDLQKNRLSETKELSDLSELLNDKVKIYLFNYSGKDVYNLGLDEIKVNTQIFEKEKPVSFTVTVTNYSKQAADNAVVSLFLNGERSAQQSISLAGGEIKSLEMDAVTKSAGYIEVFAELEDDEILHDNRRYANIFIPKEIPVIIFSDAPSDLKFVELALTAAGSEHSIKITKKSTNQIASFNLNLFDAVFIIGAENVKNPERLKSFVQSGGGLFVMPGENTTIASFQNLLNNIGLPQPSLLVDGSGNEAMNISFSQVEYNHPIFQNLFAKDEKKNIASPDIYKYFKSGTAEKGISIISLIDGSSFLSEYKQGEGKIFLLNSAPVLNWTNLPLKSVFVPLINKSVFYLAAKDRGQQKYFAGEPIQLNQGKAVSSMIKIVKPENTEELLTVEEAGNNFIHFNNTQAAGNYKFLADEKIIEIVSINTDPKESVTEYITAGDFEDYLNDINFKGSFLTVEKSEDPAQVVLQARFGSELWKYFLFFALLLALIEMAVARSAKKDLAEVK